MVTIDDVARAAGVSRSTVSYALSGKRPITRETRDRISVAIDQLGFTVNAGARALASSETMVLGLLLQFHQDEFPPAMLQYILAVTTASRELGYDILLVTEADGADAVKRITSSNMVDGVVLLDVTHDDPRLAPLREARQPGAMVGLPARHRRCRRLRPRLREARRASSSITWSSSATGRSSWSRRRGTCSSGAAPTRGGSATRRSSRRRATALRCTSTTANPSSRASRGR